MQNRVAGGVAIAVVMKFFMISSSFPEYGSSSIRRPVTIENLSIGRQACRVLEEYAPPFEGRK